MSRNLFGKLGCVLGYLLSAAAGHQVEDSCVCVGMFLWDGGGC